MDKSAERFELEELFVRLIERPSTSTLALLKFFTQYHQQLLPAITDIANLAAKAEKNNTASTEQKNYLDQIHQQATKLLRLINGLNNLQNDSSHSESNLATSELNPTMILKDIAVLIADDNTERQQKLATALTNYGMLCVTSTVEETLTMLREVPQKQIAIIVAPDYDHHTAYLARAVKSNNSLNHIMMCIGLINEIPEFEKERIHFDGFSCILHLNDAHRFAKKLAQSWRSWSVKLDFSQQKKSTAKTKRILLTEDDPVTQKTMQWQLQELNYKVDLAKDGQSALKLLNQNAYDLIFMDIGLPDISGLEVTAEIRAREEGSRHTPIIGLTVHTLEKDQQTGLRVGMDEYFSKPLSQERLKVIIEKWVK